MFTKAEVKEFKKGFHPSRSGKSHTATVGRGFDEGSRYQRRKFLSDYGMHRNKAGILLVEGHSKYRSRIQTIYVKKLGLYTGEIKRIIQWDKV